jgi:hypothetical protein
MCWLKFFLFNRYISVKVNTYLRKKIIIETGVPQGSVVSQILFSIFINDLPMKNRKNKFYSMLLADDLCDFKIYQKVTSKIVHKYI